MGHWEDLSPGYNMLWREETVILVLQDSQIYHSSLCLIWLIGSPSDFFPKLQALKYSQELVHPKCAWYPICDKRTTECGGTKKTYAKFLEDMGLKNHKIQSFSTLQEIGPLHKKAQQWKNRSQR